MPVIPMLEPDPDESLRTGNGEVAQSGEQIDTHLWT
jgi:hypothetical protein